MAINSKSTSRLFDRIDRYRDEMVSFQKEMTALIALSPESNGQGEMQRARWIQKKLMEFGLSQITEYNAPDPRVEGGIRPNFVVRLVGESPSPAVWVMAHMDTVPPGEMKLWESDPFQLRITDGKLIGRGTEDNQQGLTCGIFAMRAFIDEKIKPTTDVCLMLVSDEETGNKYGIDHVLKAQPQLIKPLDLVIVPDAGSPDGSMVEVAEKSILWCEFTVKGKQVHASTPHQGINAHRAAAYLVVRLDQKLHQMYGHQDEVFDPPLSTFEPTKKEPNVPNVNTIPGEDRFYLDCRILPEYDVDAVIKTIREIMVEIENEFKVSIQMDFPNVSRAAPATPVSAPVVKYLSQAIKTVRNIDAKAIGIGGGTVAALFRRHGIPAAVWSTMEDTAHQPNEFCLIDNMVQDTKVFSHIFARDK